MSILETWNHPRHKKPTFLTPRNIHTTQDVFERYLLYEDVTQTVALDENM
jgi:hypothetical protein